jgi:hypothetical protein
MRIIKTDAQNIFKKIAFRNRYDLLANEATRDIFETIKNNYQNTRESKESFEYKNTNYIIDLKLSHDNLIDKKFDMRADFNEPDVKAQTPPYIEIRITLDYNFSKDDFERLNYAIYEFIRHEYEHFYSYDHDIFSSKEYYDNLRALQDMSLSLLERAKLVEKNVLDPYEIDAYARSVVYVAKKRKVRFQKVLWEALDIMFFGFSEKDQNLGRQNREIMNIYNNILDKTQERIHQIFQIKRTAMISTRGLERW